jgi:hypothetical protein
MVSLDLVGRFDDRLDRVPTAPGTRRGGNCPWGSTVNHRHSGKLSGPSWKRRQPPSQGGVTPPGICTAAPGFRNMKQPPPRRILVHVCCIIPKHIIIAMYPKIAIASVSLGRPTAGHTMEQKLSAAASAGFDGIEVSMVQRSHG